MNNILPEFSEMSLIGCSLFTVLTINNKLKNMDFLLKLQDLIDRRKKELPDGSYTTKLFNEGINRIAQKVGEEAVELIIESKDNNNEKFLNEAADLMYHLLVLLSAKGYRIEDVISILEERHR
jgi:phosphoribosyl-AMP cyclohydrolase / phosphoribosyl-ATP pyrophosphohydrolase